MTTSGTATWTPDIIEIVDEAYERCGVEGARTGYDLRTARRSLNLLFADWANRGLNLWTIAQATAPLTAGAAICPLPADVVDVVDIAVRTGTGGAQTDSPLTRISAATYAAITRKELRGRPTQCAVDRQRIPRLLLWPVPDTGAYTLSYWYLRRIQDTGDGTHTADVPFRFLPALVAGLAYYLALKTPDGLSRVALLKSQYDEAWALAESEDREKASVRFVPRITL